MRRVLGRLLLALSVVLFQHGAVAHVLVHASEAAHHDEQGESHAPHGCDACHAFAAAEGGEPPAHAHLPVAPPAGTASPQARRPAARGAAPKPYHSQAPPARS
jgi:hypothetical protein